MMSNKGRKQSDRSRPAWSEHYWRDLYQDPSGGADEDRPLAPWEREQNIRAIMSRPAWDRAKAEALQDGPEVLVPDKEQRG